MTLSQQMIIDCTNEYHKSIDRLAKLVRVAVERLEAELKRHKIMARVTGRVKSRDSLHKKLEKWSLQLNKTGLFNTKHDVFSLVGDLAAIRVMTYVEQDRERVAAIAREIFSPRAGKDDFEYEVKESSPRIKDDDANYYRATHLQVCLRASDLQGDNSNLKEDHCELQITSMLAHVWNEIEHDIVYKGDKTVLNEEERSALESLGLLTKSGDNIIVSLINANVRREAADQRKLSLASEEIVGVQALSDTLHDYYGSSLFGRSIDYWKNADALFQALQHLNLVYPKDIFSILSPSHLHYVLKTEIPAFKKFSTKQNFYKPIVAPDTCDLLLIGLIAKHYTDLTKQAHVGRGPKPRQLNFALRWEAFVSSRN
ncbi:hypothetical protein [Agrobacterium tumefaciens]|uniref:hypothetical protein n=1 Tax=Agrobacterium tumefaciens TaxID=358 RepID=UPI003BA128CD